LKKNSKIFHFFFHSITKRCWLVVPITSKE
jgi:hypothetical protein